MNLFYRWLAMWDRYQAIQDRKRRQPRRHYSRRARRVAWIVALVVFLICIAAAL